MIPAFDGEGYLPPGIHMATVQEIDARFGRESELRRVQMESLVWLIGLARRAGARRIVVNGSFVTDKLEPNDVDCVLLFGTDFPRWAAEHFVRLTSSGQRVPVSVVHYTREVFVSPDPDRPRVRLTLDHRVSASTRNLAYNSLYQERDVALIPPDWVVMEMKFGGTKPGWMRRICRELGLRAVPVSKFGLSVAMGVAGNRYHEVRYLTPRPLRRLGLPPRTSGQRSLRSPLGVHP